MNQKRIILFIIVVIYLFMLRYMFQVVFPFLLAFVCFFTLKPIIDYIENHLHIKRSAIGVSLLLFIYLILIFIIGSLLTYAFVFIFRFINQFPIYYENLLLPGFQQILSWIQDHVPLLMNSDNLETLSQFFQQSLLSVVTSFSSFMSHIPSVLFSFFIFIISTFFLFVEYDEMKEKLIQLCSPSFVMSFIKVKNQSMRGIRIYLKCQIILMSISFAILCCGFFIMRFPNSILYAFLTALLDSLPFIGVGIVLIPICIVYILQGAYLKAFYIFLIYLIINVVRSLLEPHIMNKQMKIPSFLLLVSMTIHLYLFGIIGVILSPIHMNLLYCFLDYYQNK